MTVLGSFDVESVGLDVENPENRVLSIAFCGDVHPDGLVLMYKNEETTLARFIEEAEKHDALLGWNTDGFDVPLLRARFKAHGIDMDYIRLPIFLDCMRIHNFMLRKQETSYTLDHVSKRHLKEGKLPFDPNRMMEVYEKDKERLAEYNLHDAELVWRLNKVFGYFSTFDAIVKRSKLSDEEARKFAGISQKEDGGFAWWRPLMGLVRQFCAREGRPVPGWPTDTEKLLRKAAAVERPGGFVETPLPGHHRNVIEFDFRSLYPTLIQTFNLGFDTCAPDGDIVTSCGRFRSRPRSIVASILDEIVVERSDVKREYEERKAEGAGPDELVGLKGKIEALKVFHNAFYGQMYAPFSPLYNYESAKTITTIGQECVKTMLEKMRELGLTVVAGDTDSTYVSVPEEMYNKETALRLSEELTAHISMRLKEKYGADFAGSFDFKGLISHFASKKKKFYARLENGKPVTDIELKGYVRGNTPDLQRELQRRVFEVMFSGGDIGAMLAEERKKFLSSGDHTGLLSWMQVHTTRENVAQVRAKRVLKEAGVAFERFEQVGFLLVGKGKKRRRIAAHRLPDSTVEWLIEGEKTLHQETALLSLLEAEGMWGILVKKVDFA